MLAAVFIVATLSEITDITPPDKCVWWEAVNDETGEADFHAKRLRDIISMINEALGVQNGS